jgi:hypothetical protein
MHLATLLLSTSVQAREEDNSTPQAQRGEQGPDTYFALISAAQSARMHVLLSVMPLQRRVTSSVSKLSYDGLSGPELFSHVHGPAAIGETGLSSRWTSQLRRRFYADHQDQKKDLDDEFGTSTFTVRCAQTVKSRADSFALNVCQEGC